MGGRKRLGLGLAVLATAATLPAAQAETVRMAPSGAPVPRFESLAADEVNGRSGPSLQHPVAFVYRRRGLPVQVVGESGPWRQVRDPDGALVWMHRIGLSSRASVMVTGDENVPLRTRPEASGAARVVAWLEAGVVAERRGCGTDGWLRVRVAGREGWLPPGSVWGAACTK